MTTTATLREDGRATRAPGPAEDQQLRTAALEGLRSSGYLPLRDLRCDVSDGVVTVSGRVPSFHLKQVAQTVLLRVRSVRGLRNLVEVR